MFNIEKVIQSCNYLIKKNGASLNYTKLIKLLYLADKESLKESLQTITGDAYVSMDNGPVLSKLYDLIKGKYNKKDIQERWNNYFLKDGHELKAIVPQIPQDELSAFERKILDQVYERYRNCDVWDLVAYVHKNCPEWKDPEGSSIPIKPEEILESIGKTPEEIDWMIAEANAFEEEERAFLSLA